MKKTFASALAGAFLFSSLPFFSVFAKSDEHPREKLAAFSTYFSETDKGRCANIALAAARIDGIALQPYGEFSFNACVGERTAEKGYKQAKKDYEAERARKQENNRKWAQEEYARRKQQQAEDEERAALIRRLKDPRVADAGMVSIIRVDTTGDLRYARVWVSVLDKTQEKDVLKGLKSAAGFLRRELGRALQLRYTPELVWEKDDSIVYGAKMLELINSLELSHDDEE